MRNLHIARSASESAIAVEVPNVPDWCVPFTPTDFVKEAGTVVAVCLGLGLLMQVLLG